MLPLILAAAALAQISPAPVTFSGMMVSNGGSSTAPNAGDFPGVGSNAALPFGVYRIWDTSATASGHSSAALAWPGMQTSTEGGTLNLSSDGQAALDLELLNLHTSNSSAVAMYTLSRTPWWTFGLANNSCHQTDTSGGCDNRCNYDTWASWDGTGGSKEIYAPGQCELSPDLTTANGSGVYTNLNWRNWITALANHLNSLSTSYAKVKYFEIWNEFDRSNSLTGEVATSNLSYQGNYAQMLRMTEDARCILLGASAQPTIHNYNTSGGTEACNTTNFPNGIGLMAGQGVEITTPSAHAQGANQKQIN